MESNTKHKWPGNIYARAPKSMQKHANHIYKHFIRKHNHKRHVSTYPEEEEEKEAMCRSMNQSSNRMPPIKEISRCTPNMKSIKWYLAFNQAA